MSAAASRMLRKHAAWLVALPLLTGCGDGGEEARFDPDTVPEAYLHSSAALMWPGATRAFRVTPEGDFDNGAWRVHVVPSANGDTADAPRVIAFEERWRPVAHWARGNGPLRWDFQAVALPEGAPRDTGLLVSVQARATNTGSRTVQATLEFVLEPPAAHREFVAFDAVGSPRLRWGSEGSRDTVLGWGPGRIEGERLRFELSLAAGESRTARTLLTVYPSPAPSLADWARQPHSKRLREARRYWERAVDAGTRFDLGDAEVENAVRAATVVLLSLRERRGPLWVPIGGPFHYRDVWLRDGARAVHALAITGHTRIARELARGLAEFQWPNGAFMSQRGQLDGTGQALWAFEQAVLRPAADDSVGRFADRALAAVRWVEWQRELGRNAGWPYGEMLPFGDPRDAELLRAQLVGNDAWALAGYRSAERLLAAAGRDSEAAEVRTARERYLRDFERALEARGHSDLPPAWQPGGRDWGNLAVAWPCAALPPGDARCQALARRVWGAAGGAGLVSYGPADSAHNYVGADLGTWALLAGHRAEADSVLAAMLHWRSASGAACEIFSRSSRDFGANLTPHPTSAAALIALVRNMLIEDHADTLRLTLGARPEWWRGSRVRGAPTRWGSIDLEFESDSAAARWRWSPVSVWTELTLPPGAAPAADVLAPLVPGARADLVLAPPGTRTAAVAITRRAASRP